MTIHRVDIWFREEDVTPHVAGFNIMVLRETVEKDPQAFVIPNLFVNKDGENVPVEKSVYPSDEQIDQQVQELAELCKSAPGNVYIHVLRRQDIPNAFGLCAHDKKLEKWSFTDFALPGMEVADIETYVNGEKI